MPYRAFILISGALACALVAAPVEARRSSAQWYSIFYPPGVPLPDHVVSLRLQITPREALVYVDGFAAGLVDDYDGVFQRLRLVPGPHEVVIYQPGYRALRQSVYYNPGSSHTIKYTLEPLLSGEAAEPPPTPRALPQFPGVPPPPVAGLPPAATRAGMLALRVQPADATILIDGQPWSGPAFQDRLVMQLPEGTHRVLVEKPGFQPFMVDVDVRPGETASFNVSLVP